MNELKGFTLAILLAVLLAACTQTSQPGPPAGEKPGAFQVSGKVSCVDEVRQVELTWSAAAGAASYQVLRDGTELGDELTARTFTDNGSLTVGATYEYVVRARNTQGTTDSNAWSVTIEACETEGPVDPERLPVRSLARGGSHVLAVLEDGTVLSWGENEQGELGRPAGQEIGLPELIQGLDGVTSVAAGVDWSLALDEDGLVWSWGSNDWGQLGDGTTDPFHTPQPVAGITHEIVAIEAGRSFALALTRDGQVYSWGSNDRRQLANGEHSSSPNPNPRPIADLVDVVQVAAGNVHALALLEDGTVLGWGANSSGQGGVGSTSPFNLAEPTEVVGLPDGVNIVRIAAGGEHSLAVSSDGRLFVWGDNYDGQLGNGESGLGARSASAIELNLEFTVDIAVAGGSQSFVRDDDGNWYAWGMNSGGQLGDGGFQPVTEPTLQSNKTNLTLLATDNTGTVAADSEGGLFAWGSAWRGELGTNVRPEVLEPTPVASLTDVVQVSASGSHTLALTEAGAVYAWGNNSFGQLGLGDLNPRIEPTRVGDFNSALAVAAGGEHSLVLLGDGTLLAFGSNEQGQLGTGDNVDQLSPVPVPGLSGVTLITAAASHSLAVLDNDQVWGWGANGSRQLGNGGRESSNSPVLSTTLPGVNGISTGIFHTLASVGTGARAWGSGINGQLGNGLSGSGEFSATPVTVLALTAPTDVSVGHASSFALQDGAVWVWGSNHEGEHGDGGIGGQVATPTLQADSPLVDVERISAGGEHVLALQADGKVYSWGNNGQGQLGNGDPDLVAVPAPVFVTDDAKAVFAGAQNSFALLNDGSLLAWGNNYSGQLGTGQAAVIPEPTPVTY